MTGLGRGLDSLLPARGQAVVHITWPDDRPQTVEASVHLFDGPLRDVAENVMATIASHGHIVTLGSRTFPLGEPWDPQRLEYSVLVELDETERSGPISMLWHHVFAYVREPWATEPKRAHAEAVAP